jgi:hypothetical protein
MVPSATEPVAWFWAPPLRQPIIKRRGSVLACAAKAPLKLGDICCCCGKPKAQPRPLKVVAISNNDAILGIVEMFAGHAGHLATGIQLLSQPKAKVPCCSKCHLLHFWGMAAGIALVLAGLGLLIAWAASDDPTKLRGSVWVDFGKVVGCFSLVAVGAGVSALFDWRALPVRVYRVPDGRLYYEFWSQRYYEKGQELKGAESLKR